MAWYRLNKLESRPKARFTYGPAGSVEHPQALPFNGMFLDNGFSIAIATNVALPNGESFEGTATKLIAAIPE
jgi:hypothetical protein